MHFSIKKYILPLSAFVVGFALMVMELTASRVLAPIVGSSLYTWTSVIGIIMLGLAAGNFIGGYYIDRNNSAKTIFVFFILSSISVFLIPLVSLLSRKIALWEMPILAVIMLITSLIFFVPSLLIGCIYPCIFKFYVKELAAVGKNAGRISALWTLGSILGTFLTGFVFISYFGSVNTLFMVALALFINGLFFYIPSWKNLFLFLIFFSALILFSNRKTDLSKGGRVIFDKESAYYSIKIVDTKNKPPYGNARFMFLDFDSHGMDGGEIKKLNLYINMHPIFALINESIKDILVLGGGPETITKNFSVYYPSAKVTNVEIDPQVSKAARDFFGTGLHKIESETSDGRIFLQKNLAQYDLIFNDTYNSFISVPWHLSTDEFNKLIKIRLTKNGIYAVNFISAREGDASLFFQSMLKTFKLTFPNYYVFSFDSDPEKVQNIVLIGINSERHLSEREFKEKILLLPDQSFLAKDLMLNPSEEVVFGDKTPILSDNFAPTERLMAPVINDYFSKFSSFYYSIF